MKRRRALGCLAALLAALVVFTVMLEYAGLQFISPLNWVDPSDGDDDPELADAIRRALVDQPSGPLAFLDGDEKRGVLDVPLDDAGKIHDFSRLEERLRRVPGWDLIAILGSMESGARAAQDPRIRSAWLRRRLAMQRNGDSDIFQYMLLVVRDDQFVTSIRIRFACLDVQPLITADLARRLERALTLHADGPVKRSELYPQSEAAVVEGRLSLDEFRLRASTVTGWDQIVIVGAYDNERLVADDPALTSAAVREAVRDAISWPGDGMKTLLVIRDGRVVDKLTLECQDADADLWSCVVERTP